jgi:transcriptional regulator with XRE-family HTH domain
MGPDDGRHEAAKIGERLQRARQKAGASQLAVAQALGVTRPTVSNWEAGRNQPSLIQFRELLTMYGASPQMILYGAHRVSFSGADRRELLELAGQHASPRIQAKIDILLGFIPNEDEG